MYEDRYACFMFVFQHVSECLRIKISLLSFIDIDMLGPEFNRDCWFNEKFNLGLDFPNVSEI